MIVMCFFAVVHCGGEGGGFTVKVCATINDVQLGLANGDTFDVMFGTADRKPRGLDSTTTWIEIPGDANSVVTRHYFEDLMPAASNSQKT